MALVVAPFAAPEVLEADSAVLSEDALAAGTETAGEAESMTAGSVARSVVNYSGKVSTDATIAGTGTDAAQGHWGAVGVDVAFLAAPGAVSKSFGASSGDAVSDALKIGEETAARSADAFTRMQDFKILDEMGITDAKGLAFRDGAPPPSLRGIDLENPAAVKAATDEALKSANTAAARALHFGRPVANLFDNLISDPAEDGIKHHFHLEPAGG